MRAERAGLYALAARADRSLRTLAARRCAAEAHDLARIAIRSVPEFRGERALAALAQRPAWMRLTAQQFAYSFGARRIAVTVPHAFTAEELASLIARVEVRVLLGDSSFDLITHFQTLAERELQRLFATR